MNSSTTFSQVISKNNQKYKDILKLFNSQKLKKSNYFIVPSKKLIDEYEKKFQLMCLISNKKDSLDIYKTNKCEKILLSTELFKSFKLPNIPKNLIGIFKKEKFLNKIKATNTIIFDNIQLPNNLGSLLRVCSAFNIEQILITNDSANCYYYKTILATRNADIINNVCYLDKQKILKYINNLNLPLVISVINKIDELKDFKFKNNYMNKWALVMGSEGQGISDFFINNANFYYSIKQSKKLESLNVAVAAGIIINQLINNKN